MEDVVAEQISMLLHFVFQKNWLKVFRVKFQFRFFDRYLTDKLVQTFGLEVYFARHDPATLLGHGHFVGGSCGGPEDVGLVSLNEVAFLLEAVGIANLCNFQIRGKAE